MSGWKKKAKHPSTGTTYFESANTALSVVCVAVACLSVVAPVTAEEEKLSTNTTPYIDRQVVKEFVREVAARNDLNHNEVIEWFQGLKPQQHILEAISTPAERTLKWREYRPIFLGDKRISAGRDFLVTHESTLKRAEAEFGVPAEIIAAIIGVETFYGKHTGKHGALESLVTLAFDYPPRSEFFTKELEAFLILSSEEGWDPLERRGSYAAAMGFPQFIASSYRAYAVDFNGDGKRDLINSIDDAIGSVGNYLAEHGWDTGEPIASRWKTTTENAAEVAKLRRESLKPKISVHSVQDLGFDPAGNGPVSVMALKGKNGTETWVGYKNFYVITRYNHSRLYAMAVMQLAEQLKVEG